MKPSEYRNEHIVMQDVSYVIAEEKPQEHLSRTGMLHVGRVVWLPDDPKPLDDARVPAWAEGIGSIWVSRNSLAAGT